MRLRHIERGTRLDINEKAGNHDESPTYEAIFYDIHDLINETSFIVQCSKLNRNFSSIDRDTVLEISFTIGPSVYTFTGRASGKMYTDMVIIEQLSEIDELNRRKYQRDEIRVEVRVYGLPEEQVNGPRFVHPTVRPAMVDVSFDISAGGMCVVTNTSLTSEYDPFYLVEFSLTDKDTFLLPAKLVRRSKYARSRIGKFDYGFQFLFDGRPDEMSHLTKAILSKKLSFFSA